MMNSEFAMEVRQNPAKMHFESYAPRMEIAGNDRSVRDEHSDTSQKMGTQGSRQLLTNKIFV